MYIVMICDMSDWATEEEFDTMTEEQIIELANEDIRHLVNGDGAKWTVVR